ncbi:MAG: alpha/beta hydrolase, partial [SAR202 cluster bacterium]|nr:alpha/beta hydrolase [SAR202 cluster bacterium]
MAGQYITLNGVKTYYEVEGNGSPVVLLHGGAAPIETLSHQRRALAHQHRVYMPERRAQGRTPDVDGPLSYEAMVDDTIAFLEDVVGGPAALVGWSDGANVALL